jgi:ubiquinone/menaquinone biosynthesis C-methylase UbiE
MPSLNRLLAFALCFVCAGMAAAQTPHTHQHSFSGAEDWARVFDDPERDRWQKPHEVIMALKPASDARVADIGAGTGYFSVRLAHMVPQGRIYAVDLEPDMVRHLGERATRSGLKNMQPVQATADSAELPEKVDLVLLVDTYHHIGDRAAYFSRLRGNLRPEGRVAIIDFTPESPVGPPRTERVASAKVVDEMKVAGFTEVARHGFLPYQYFLIFEPKK